MKAVDLGLPSGLKWADCNVGAEKETDYGLYFQFGDTVGYQGGEEAASHSTWATCTGNGGNSTYNKDSIADWDRANLNNGVLKPEVDAATVHLGSNWRIPTTNEIIELYENTVNESTKIDGVKGRKFISKVDSSKYIFLPFVGGAVVGSFSCQGVGGLWWSSSVFPGASENAFFLYVGESGAVYGDDGRYYAISIRGVCK